MNYRITIGLRKSIKDNQGDAVLNVLHNLGFTNVTSIRISKFITVSGDGRKVNPEKIAVALANPVMEDYTIEKSKKEWHYRDDRETKGENND